jgi:hypothetical protein
MHTLKTLQRINTEWPHPKTPKERREEAIRCLEQRLCIVIDRHDPMIAAIAEMELALQRAIAPR